MISPALGSAVTGAAELSGGGFAAVWRATLADGREVVVKVGPPASARLLRYEAGMITSEADYFRAVAGLAPVPSVLAATDDWIVTSFLPGRPLTEVSSGAAREELGGVMARVHELTGPHFGYTGKRASGPDWPTAYRAVMEDLLADAQDWEVPLPDGIRPAIDRHRSALAVVTRPALLHFDLWDGNVLVEDDHLSGLVDGERFLYGDPLLDLVSPALFHRIEDDPGHPFLRGYRAATGLVVDDAARVRLGLYRLHLYTLMLAEGPSRGIPAGSDRQQHVTALLEAELAEVLR
ncbi:aminoglycoside phosphotransferase family protein [Actinoplanes sp. RD1]|uniref:aminoglycoside phosphotransferase family protein n=1 Tax=Actinoplanes sp. RD1 TaxID=3064538 RepID=UPI002740E30D|nr:aminoglycoside phosphotransferase family protein [Actinoplanes sp. RD1]